MEEKHLSQSPWVEKKIGYSFLPPSLYLFLIIFCPPKNPPFYNFNVNCHIWKEKIYRIAKNDTVVLIEINHKVFATYAVERWNYLYLKLSQLCWKYFTNPLTLLSTVENSCVTPSWVRSMCGVLMLHSTVLIRSLIIYITLYTSTHSKHIQW